jgi:hypothetical protein
MEEKLSKKVEEKIDELIHELRMTHLFGPIDHHYRDYEEVQRILRIAYKIGFQDCDKEWRKCGHDGGD